MSDATVDRLPQLVAGRDTDHPAERVELTRPSIVRAVAVVSGVALLAALVVAISTVMWWLAIAAVTGAVLYPASALLKRHMPSGLALVLIVVAVLAGSAWLGLRGVTEIKDQAESARTGLVESARQAEASPVYGSTVKKLGLTEKVDAAFGGITGSSGGGSSPLQIVSSSGGALFSIAMLSLLFLIFWPQLFAGALRQAGDNVRRDLLRAHLRRSFRRCARYGWLMALRASVVGVVAAFISAALGAGTPTLIGLWFAACSLVPALGLVIAVLPLAVLSAAHSPGQAVMILGAVIILQAVDAVVVQRRIDTASVRLGPAVSFLAAMLGFELYGVGGALVLLALACFSLSFLDSLTHYRRDLVASMKTLTECDDDTATLRQTTAAVSATDGTVTWWYELGWRTPLLMSLAVVGFAALIMVVSAGPVVALIVTATLLSFALDPIITRFQRWTHLPRGVAVGALFCAVAAVAIGGVVAFAPSTVEQAGTVQQDLPKAVDDLTQLPFVGPVLADNHAPDKIRDWATELPTQIANDPSGIATAASTAGTAALAALAVAIMLMALLIDGPYLVRIITVAIPDQRLAPISRAGNLLTKTAGRYFSGSLILAGLQALQVLVTGLLLGVPLTPVLAIWAGIWTLVPQIGGAIGGLPFILLAFSHGATTGLIATAAFGIYIVIANNVLLPVIVGKAVDVSPLATMAATIAGFTLLGVVGAILAVPILGAAKSIYKELRPDRPDEPVKATGRTTGRVRARAAHIRQRAEGPPAPVHAPA